MRSSAIDSSVFSEIIRYQLRLLSVTLYYLGSDLGVAII